MRFTVLLLVALMFAVPVVGCAAPPIVTLAAYDRIQEGMTYEQVVGVIGNDGKFLYQSGDEAQYQWANADGGVVCRFKGGKLVEKKQNGLK